MKFYISLCKFSPNMVYHILTILQYKIHRKMKMLQEYWASTVIFIETLFQCTE